MRHRTGLHNKYRGGKGTYAARKKSRDADRYSVFVAGRPSGPDYIAGRSLWAVRQDTGHAGIPEWRPTTPYPATGHKGKRGR